MPEASLASRLLPLIGGQLCLHGSMAGIRLAAPLAMLNDGQSKLAVGVLLALFAAAPVLLALPAGRMADRHGYHRPVRWAVALSLIGGVLGLLSLLLDGGGRYGLLCGAAVFSGAGAQVGLIAIQRTAGRLARDGGDLKRVYSWLGLAPAVSNVIGPVLAGALIDTLGFAAAFAALAALPLATAAWARRVQADAPPRAAKVARVGGAWGLLTGGAMPKLLLINWLLSASWDLHSFLVPVIGHERGFSASAIGLILGLFAAAVAAVRVVIPLVADHLREGRVLAVAMGQVALVFAIYPLMDSAFGMAWCAVGLGLALGAVQPMVMSTLHQITPEGRQGEAIALRSMTLNLSSTLMPLGFGLLGGAVGAAALFWLMAAMVGAGAWPARRLGVAPPPG